MSKMLLMAVAICGLLPAVDTSAQTNFNCTPTEVASWRSRVHVKCTTSPTANIVFFAVPTTNTTVVSTNADTAARFQQIALQALNSSVFSLWIRYDPNDKTTGPTFGCDASDCRPAQVITLRLKSAAAVTSQ